MKYIEILERVNEPSDLAFNYVLRTEIPSMNKTTASADPEIIEKRGTITMPTGTSISYVQEKLVTIWNEFKKQIDDMRTREYYGLYYDGKEWLGGK